jgi:plastocyanin
MEITPSNQIQPSQPQSTPGLVPPPSVSSTPPTSPQKGRQLGRLFKLVLALLLLLCLGAVIYKYVIKSDSDKTEETQTLVTNEAQVTITKDGFVPAAITVAKGTQVTWTNTDTEPHQVAADPYPKNDSIPGFDSTIVLQQDESYSFTFEQSGTYTYHDEINALILKGTVLVE